MEIAIKRWGNSLAARIPAAIARAINLGVDQKVRIETENGKIIITPITDGEYELDDLLKHCPKKAVTLDGEDREWLYAGPVGNEEW